MSENTKHNFNNFLYKSKVSISISKFEAGNICGYNTLEAFMYNRVNPLPTG